MTMSAELMKSKFDRRPSVRLIVASIISEPIAWISFKCWLLLPLVHTPRNFLNSGFFFFFYFFSNIFHFRKHGTLWEQKIQNTTPPTNRSRKISNFP